MIPHENLVFDRSVYERPKIRKCAPVDVYPCVDLAFQFDIKIIQQLFLVLEIEEQGARSNARALGDLRRCRAKSDPGNLLHRRQEDCTAFFRTSGSCHSMDKPTVVRACESRQWPFLFHGSRGPKSASQNTTNKLEREIDSIRRGSRSLLKQNARQKPFRFAVIHSLILQEHCGLVSFSRSGSNYQAR
jgi:hypothetical protein